MTLSLGTPTTIELAKCRNAAHWLVIAVALAFNWAATPLKAAGSIGCEAVAGVSVDVSQPAALSRGAAGAAVVEGNLPVQDLTALSTDEMSDDLMGASRPSQLADYRASHRTSIADRDPRAASPRLFNPRAPPLPA